MHISYLSEYVKKAELDLRGEFGSHQHVSSIYSQRTSTSMGMEERSARPGMVSFVHLFGISFIHLFIKS